MVTLFLSSYLQLFSFLQVELSNDQDVVDYIMNQPNVVPRINSRILTSDREYLDLTATSKEFFSCCEPSP